MSNAELLADLTRQMAGVDLVRGTMDIVQKLTAEAYDCAKHGDFDEARHRLRLRDEPKFYSTEQCARKYREAMSQ